MINNRKKNFITINEGFICSHCKTKNLSAKKTCRNHCYKCLHSLHVDREIPGDRESECLGLMEPVNIEHNARKGYILTHKCHKCQKVIKNKVAEDDDFEEMMKIVTRNL
ncbi:hypothetical protein A2483_01895 [Candidatus Peregrinibacteria bacterium RIFOXYC2_FULL_33_13]|nr:MAG: hypothetical protein UR27_C0022G0005 [Candidatus Peregrinibacteria bacterium GW2011_GWA2_33_10]KKP38703.1 MAG: hypothetical protein UR30_C0016G0017 [Candidatus Peregrinibacteria bacterium GW2011_GWC2_33_13]OGJ49306.1 MAG: hypothetical protein A2229_01755 [Candidatus Peregrinibacteria bacterium RIFOXYA2_FULL_33_7]OGJ51972.1 MAG: hypothetical protein A2483_01895 [Candidatus Peregrinibacteria bacterium RIFOXYC2_FULL_33_13]